MAWTLTALWTKLLPHKRLCHYFLSSWTWNSQYCLCAQSWSCQPAWSRSHCGKKDDINFWPSSNFVKIFQRHKATTKKKFTHILFFSVGLETVEVATCHGCFGTGRKPGFTMWCSKVDSCVDESTPLNQKIDITTQTKHVPNYSQDTQVQVEKIWDQTKKHTYLNSAPKSSGFNILSNAEMFNSDPTAPSSSSIKLTNSGKTGWSESLSIIWPKCQDTKQTKLINLKLIFIPQVSKIDKRHALDTRLHCIVEMVGTQYWLSLNPEHPQFLAWLLTFGGQSEHSQLTSWMLSDHPPKFRDHAKISSVLIVVTNCGTQCANPVRLLMVWVGLSRKPVPYIWRVACEASSQPERLRATKQFFSSILQRATIIDISRSN